MKKILIISPHFPPSNLAAVHRSRLFAQHLPSFNYDPIILTVDEKYYEEKLDYNLVKLLPSHLRIEKVEAFPVTRPRLLGDIGLRGFVQLYRKAKSIIIKEEIFFIYIPIPPFYAALLGRLLFESTGVKYGIDYIDPWVHTFPGSDKVFSRHWFSSKLAKILEPFAVKKASLITAVAEGYYEGVKLRNPSLLPQTVFAAMPYGGEKGDNEKVRELGLKPFLFEKKIGKIQLVYAGAMLPKAYPVLEAILLAISEQRRHFKDLEIHFIGTGKTPDDNEAFSIKPLAEKYGLWKEIIYEYPARISYLDVLIHLEASHGAFILGSTEPHYTPSKVYQSILSKKAIWAVLHSKSTACKVIVESRTGIVLHFNGESDIDKLYEFLSESFSNYLAFLANYHYNNLHQQFFEKFSAKEVTRVLAAQLDVIGKTAW